MKKHLSFLLAMAMCTSMALATDSESNTIKSNILAETKNAIILDNQDISFADFDSITSHASILYASRVLNQNGFKLAYGDEVKQRKRYYSDIAFAKNAVFDETEQKWVTTDSLPYSYVNLIYDDESQQICHYHMKFCNMVGYALFFGEMLKAGYLLDVPDKNDKDHKESVYFRESDQSFIMFKEYSDGTYFVDCWYTWTTYNNKKRKNEK